MFRKLVTIRTIKEINSISGADNIESALIDGWTCVVKRGEFKSGDLCVYFEIDSFLPIEERYEFLRKSSYRKYNEKLEDRRNEGFRIKTMKLKNVLSQGLALPLSSFPEITEEECHLPLIGQDVTGLLCVEKWEPPIPAQLSGKVKGSLPSFIQKTDEERIQNLPEYFEKCKDLSFEVTEKVDGSSMTVYFNNEVFGVCGRNLELTETEDNSLWKIVRTLNLEKHLKALGRNIALQGEIIGEGIQKNPLKISGNQFRLFNIYDIDKGTYLLPVERKILFESLSQVCPIKHVPIIHDSFKVFSEKKTIDDLLKFVEGKSAINNQAEREGLVFKSTSYDYGHFISFKVINNKYLLKGE